MSRLGFNPKVAIGRTKAPLRLVPSALPIYVSIVQELGGTKYEPYNWRKHHVSRLAYLEAILRHTLQALDGEDSDPESGVPHEAHIAACCAIILDALTIGKLVDDRYKTDGTVSKLLALAKERCAEIRVRFDKKRQRVGARRKTRGRRAVTRKHNYSGRRAA
jgi:hypothetical protein